MFCNCTQVNNSSPFVYIQIKSQSGVCIFGLISSYLLINILKRRFSKAVNLFVNDTKFWMWSLRDILKPWDGKRMTEKECSCQYGGKNPPCGKHSHFPWIGISTPSAPLLLSLENNRENGLSNTWINKWTDLRLISTARATAQSSSRVRIEEYFTNAMSSNH